MSSQDFKRPNSWTMGFRKAQLSLEIPEVGSLRASKIEEIQDRQRGYERTISISQTDGTTWKLKLRATGFLDLEWE